MKKIKTKKEYDIVIKRIETYLSKITEAGESDGLTPAEHDELKVLSSLVADYEDNILKIYPLRN